MGAGACVVIIEGNQVQAEAQALEQVAIASCQLVDYLGKRQDFRACDMDPIIEFHLQAKQILSDLVIELDKRNRTLAAGYNKPDGG